MKRICISNNKGGVGKSVSAQNISHILATRYQKKVLLIDTDRQRDTTNFYLNHSLIHRLSERDSHSEEKHLLTLKDAMLSALDDDSSLSIRDCIVPTDFENLFLLPGDTALDEAARKLKDEALFSCQKVLCLLLDEVEDEYDYCVIDCGINSTDMNVNVLYACDEVYIPLMTDDGSLNGVQTTIDHFIRKISKFSDRDLSVGGIFFTRHRPQYVVSRYADAGARSLYENYVLPMYIHECQLLPESSHTHAPLLVSDPHVRRKATADYLALTDYIVSNDRKSWLEKYKDAAESANSAAKTESEVGR